MSFWSRFVFRGPRSPLPRDTLGATLHSRPEGLVRPARRPPPEVTAGPSGAERALEESLAEADRRAARGDLDDALALVEGVLLRAYDLPGARERHARFRARRSGAGARDARLASPADTTLLGPPLDPATPFAIRREAGRGGSAVVYEAEDRLLGRTVALKVYHRASAGQSEADRRELLAARREQLTQEGEVAATLAGSGVLEVFDVDPTGGWLALEWAEGGSLAAAIAASNADVAPSRWALPLARALARVHSAGWVHGDLKPSNVLFRCPQVPLLADFGAATRTGAAPKAVSATFASPERLAGALATPADDVFGFGRLLEEAQAVAPAGGGIDLEPLIRACLAPAPRRPASGAALAGWLEDHLRLRAP